MLFYKCGTCGLLSSELFTKCPSCGVDSIKTQEMYSKIVFAGKLPQKPIRDCCPECGSELDWTYEINYDAKDGEDPRIYGEICSNCGYENWD